MLIRHPPFVIIPTANLISEPVGPLDGVVHVPAPVVGLHVAERRVDAALRRHRVGPRREQLRDDGRLEPLLHETEGRAEPGPSRAHDDGVVLVVDDGVLARDVLVHLRGALARRAPEAPGGRGGNGPAKASILTEFSCHLSIHNWEILTCCGC